MPACRRVFLGTLLAISAPSLLDARQATVHPRDLLTAARRGDLTALRAALDAGVNVDTTDPWPRQTALIRAAMFGQAEVARLLIARGADVSHGAAPDGMTALHWAAAADAPAIVTALVGAGADVHGPDGVGQTPLDYALGGFGMAGAGPAAVDALLAAGASAERLRDSIAERIDRALDPDEPVRREALRRVIRARRGLERGNDDHPTALLRLADRAHRAGADVLAGDLLAAGANVAARDGEGRTSRAIVEARLATERNAASRQSLTAVLEALGRGEAGR